MGSLITATLLSGCGLATPLSSSRPPATASPSAWAVTIRETLPNQQQAITIQWAGILREGPRWHWQTLTQKLPPDGTQPLIRHDQTVSSTPAAQSVSHHWLAITQSLITDHTWTGMPLALVTGLAIHPALQWGPGVATQKRLWDLGSQSIPITWHTGVDHQGATTQWIGQLEIPAIAQPGKDSAIPPESFTIRIDARPQF
ncbi:hypothetical protein TPY_2656 [Sulfobacillus acidophilus TPY]|nr:hypothetical protein TPY_2656 [Sulfobacillus acidophilus TPY]